MTNNGTGRANERRNFGRYKFTLLKYLSLIFFGFVNSALACDGKVNDINGAISGVTIEVLQSKRCNLVLVSGPAHVKEFPKLDKLVLVLNGRSETGTAYFSTYINTTQSESGEHSGGVCVSKNDAIQLDIEVSYVASAGISKCDFPSYTFKNIQEYISDW